MRGRRGRNADGGDRRAVAEGRHRFSIPRQGADLPPPTRNARVGQAIIPAHGGRSGPLAQNRGPGRVSSVGSAAAEGAIARNRSGSPTTVVRRLWRDRPLVQRVVVRQPDPYRQRRRRRGKTASARRADVQTLRQKDRGVSGAFERHRRVPANVRMPRGARAGTRAKVSRPSCDVIPSHLRTPTP